MNPELQLQQQIQQLRQQGYNEQQIIGQLTGSGWDYSMVIGALTGTLKPGSGNKKSSKKVLFVLLAIILVAVPAGWYFTRQEKQPEVAQTAVADVPQEQQKPKDIQTNLEMDKYVQFDDLKDITFMMSKEWTGKTSRPQASLVSLFNYDPEKVKAELTSDNRLPSANFYDDVTPRELDTYPGSLDKMYEVQVQVRGMVTNEPLTQESASKIEDTTDLQTYKVNDHFVADYILKGEEGLVDQRKIILRNSDGSKEVRITIDPRHSREKITKENFDGLMELVGSIQFRE